MQNPQICQKCVCVYVCMCVYVCVCMCLYVSVCVCLSVYLSILGCSFSFGSFNVLADLNGMPCIDNHITMMFMWTVHYLSSLRWTVWPSGNINRALLGRSGRRHDAESQALQLPKKLLLVLLESQVMKVCFGFSFDGHDGHDVHVQMSNHVKLNTACTCCVPGWKKGHSS